MRLPFVDRANELARLRAVLRGESPGLAVLYGRRRLGKSRLIQEALDPKTAVYYVGDERDAALQRASLAREIGAVIEGFGAATWPDWSTLLEAWFRQAPNGAVLAIDELPSLVTAAPELPSVLQKLLDARQRPLHVVLAGSSQRLMHGLVLDGSAPLYGRAQELLKIGPLPIGWLKQCLPIDSPRSAVEAWSLFGGVPRYWELAREFAKPVAAFEALALDPLGVLHGEPERLLYDELDDAARASSVLQVVASGAHRASEIAGRIGLPITTLSRPLAKLVDLGLVARDVPFGESARDGKRSLYRVSDPFLRAWFRFVEPNRSRLERGDLAMVRRVVAERWDSHAAESWEELSRQTLPTLRVAGRQWASGERWWGHGERGDPFELDVVAPSVEDRTRLLVGEVKLTVRDREVDRLLESLEARINRCPALKRFAVTPVLFALAGTRKPRPDVVAGAQWWRAVQSAKNGERSNRK